jgi:hypothetical protein
VSSPRSGWASCREDSGPICAEPSASERAIRAPRSPSPAGPSRSQCAASGRRPRRFEGGFSFAISRSSRTAASVGVAHSITRSDSARGSMSSTARRVSLAVK